MSNSVNVIPLFKVFISDHVESHIGKVLKSGNVAQGVQVKLFEERLEKYLGSDNVCSVNSATSGLSLVFHMLKTTDQRRDIVTTPLTCSATSMSILANGLRIKWADVNENNPNVNLDDVESKLDENTLAFVVVHWGGMPLNLEKIESIKRNYFEKYKKEIHVVEDCAHAFGSTFNGRKIGSHNNIQVFSFQAVKTLTCGDGGCISFRDSIECDRGKKLRWYGLDRNKKFEDRVDYAEPEWGFKYNMNEISASIGNINMYYISDLLKRNSSCYNKLFYGLSSNPDVKISTADYDLDYFSSNFLFTIYVDNRDEFIKKMKSNNVEASKVHTRNDYFKSMIEFKTKLDILDSNHDKICCIPCGWWMSDEDIDCVIKSVNEGW